MSISTHVLDTSRGRPAGGIDVRLEHRARDGWQVVGRGTTDADGRVRTLAPADAALAAGTYRLVFDVGGYFAGMNTDTFYADVTIAFVIRDPAQHYHVPLLVSPFGYTTYRGT